MKLLSLISLSVIVSVTFSRPYSGQNYEYPSHYYNLPGHPPPPRVYIPRDSPEILLPPENPPRDPPQFPNGRYAVDDEDSSEEEKHHHHHHHGHPQNNRPSKNEDNDFNPNFVDDTAFERPNGDELDEALEALQKPGDEKKPEEEVVAVASEVEIQAATNETEQQSTASRAHFNVNAKVVDVATNESTDTTTTDTSSDNELISSLTILFDSTTSTPFFTMTSTTEETTTANSAITDDAALLPINPSASPEPLPTITDIENDNETTVVSQGFPDGTTTFEPLTDTTEEEPLPTESTDFFTDDNTVTEATTNEFPTDFPIETTTDNFPFDFSESTTTEFPIDFPTESTTDNFPFEFTTSEDPLDSQTDATENQSEATFALTDAPTVAPTEGIPNNSTPEIVPSDSTLAPTNAPTEVVVPLEPSTPSATIPTEAAPLPLETNAPEVSQATVTESEVVPASTSQSVPIEEATVSQQLAEVQTSTTLADAIPLEVSESIPTAPQSKPEEEVVTSPTTPEVIAPLVTEGPTVSGATNEVTVDASTTPSPTIKESSAVTTTLKPSDELENNNVKTSSPPAPVTPEVTEGSSAAAPASEVILQTTTTSKPSEKNENPQSPDSEKRKKNENDEITNEQPVDAATDVDTASEDQFMDVPEDSEESSSLGPVPHQPDGPDGPILPVDDHDNGLNVPAEVEEEEGINPSK